MYEARQNKEKVSRRIDGGQRQKVDDDIIQRKIGFEFQTHGGNKNVEKIGKSIKQNIYKGCGFIMKADGSDLEYVTEAVDESDAAGLEQKVNNASALHEAICNSNGYKGFRDSGKVYIINGYRIFKDGEKTAHPQATVGIELDKVYSFMYEMVNSASAEVATIGYGGTTSHVNADNQKDIVSSVLSSVADIDGLSDKGRGFIAIVKQYIEVLKTFPLEQPPVNAKNAMPFMSRSNLFSYWAELDKNEQKTIDSYINGLGKGVIIAKQGNTEITLQNWFNDIKSGKDTLSQFHSVSALFMKQKMTPNKAMSKYKIENPLDIGGSRKGLLLELRAMKRKVLPEKWVEVAEAVRKVVVLMNQRTEEESERIFALTETLSYRNQ